MPASLIFLLRECLPIYAAWSQAQTLSGAPDDQLPRADVLRRYMKAQAPGARASVPPPPAPPKGADVATTRLWGWTFEPPNRVVNVTCRVNEDGHANYKVLNGITFGDDGEPRVKIVTMRGQGVELPLDTKHLYAQFVVQQGFCPGDGGVSKLWRLKANHDSGVVLVFIYEPSADRSGNIESLAPFQPSGKGNWQPVDQNELTLLGELAPSVPDKDGWLEAMTGPFMNVPGAGQQTSAKTNDKKTVKVVRPRIVVALSLATCCERADFEPGGLVGMARIFPNIMVCSAIQLQSMEATVKIERSLKTTRLDDGNGSSKMMSGGAYADPTVRPLLVADANEFGEFLGLVPTQMPFWGGTFAYFVTSADASLAGQSLHVVDRSKGSREYSGGTRVLEPRGRSLLQPKVKGGKKVPGQGEFDNLHLAPQLKLDLAELKTALPFVAYAVDGQTQTTENQVWMAPFCSHDCFHTHWRWGAQGSQPWVYGWDKDGPYKKAGAPMVPPWQDVWLELLGPSAFAYHAKSTYDTSHVSGTWDIVMHHGSAYAQSILNRLEYYGGWINIGATQPGDVFPLAQLRGTPRFVDSKDNTLSLNDPQFMYWLLRYHLDIEGGNLVAHERVQLTSAELHAARMK